MFELIFISLAFITNFLIIFFICWLVKRYLIEEGYEEFKNVYVWKLIIYIFFGKYEKE